MGLSHIYKEHMKETAPAGKSYFKSGETREMKDFINATLNYPDHILAHPREFEREIYTRNFGYTIGCDGYTDNDCTRVKVIYNFVEKVVITAFPIL